MIVKVFRSSKDENFLFDFGQRTQGTTDAEQILLEHIDTLTLEDDLHDLYCNELKNNAEEWVTLALNAIKQGHYTAAKNEIIKHIQDLDEVSFQTRKIPLFSYFRKRLEKSSFQYRKR